MKSFPITLCLLLSIFVFLPNQSNAGPSWWDKAVDTVNDLSEKSKDGEGKELSSAEIGSAFKEALQMGTENVVAQLSIKDGFNKDSSIHIPLPKNLKLFQENIQPISLCNRKVVYPTDF